MEWKNYKHLLKYQNLSIQMANLSELTFMLWNATSLNGKEEEFGYFINNKNIPRQHARLKDVQKTS